MTRATRAVRSHRGTTGAVLVATVALSVGAWVTQSGTPGPISVAEVAAAPAESKPVVALLPFTVHAEHPDLDFAASGLPQLLGRQFGRVGSVKVLGYYRLLDRISSESAPPREWRQAARDLGASIFVHGSLTDADEGVVADLWVEDQDGALLKKLSYETSVEELPAVVRSASSELLKAFSSGDLSAQDGPAFAAERLFQLGVAALEKDAFGKASELLGQAVDRDPSFAEARYYLALATWWNSVDVPAVLYHRAEALKLDLPDDKRAFLEALEPLVLNKYPQAIDAFRRAAEIHPEQREILYGLFEALFHGGYPAEAVEVYRQIRKLSPNFKLGIMHPLSFYASRGDEKGLSWALGQLTTDSRNRFWNVRARVARGDTEGALHLLDSINEGIAGPISDSERKKLSQEMARIYAMTGKTELALTLVESNSVRDADYTGWALASAMGDARLAERWRQLALTRLDKARSGYWTMSGLLRIAPMEIVSGDPERVATMLDAIDNLHPVFQPAMGMRQTRILLARSVGKFALVDEDAGSPYPVVRAMVAAVQAEREGRFDVAAKAWERAATHEGDGRFAILLAFCRASAAQRAGDWAQVLEATELVIEPRLFFWTWSTAVGPAHLMAGEALRELGRTSEAEAHFRAVQTLRARAPRSDLLKRSAAAALKAL
jgi:tetratricopeptide (TPR) repeat protein